MTAAPYLRSGQLLPVLAGQMADLANYYLYFGSRTSQPARARAFIDLAVQRLTDNPEYLIGEEHLGRRQARRHRPATRRKAASQ